MRFLVTGASGMVGSALSAFATAQGHEVVKLSRGAAEGAVRWDPRTGVIDGRLFDGVDVVVHLAGASIAERWTESWKREIRDSRVRSTRALVDAMARLRSRPKVFLCASGVGFYGDTDEDVIDEQAPSGRGFLADVCQLWEAEAWRAREFETRVVALRFGAVLSPRGGALAKLIPIFEKGMGGAAGTGRQWMSWIAIDDAVRAIAHAINHAVIDGPLNVVAPRPVRNAEFTSVLALALKKPSLLSVPAFALRMMFGDMARETVLASTRAVPRQLLLTGFEFEYPMIDAALDHLLKP